MEKIHNLRNLAHNLRNLAHNLCNLAHKKMLESRPEDALVRLVLTVVTVLTLLTVVTVLTVLTVLTMLSVLTALIELTVIIGFIEDLKKVSLTHSLSYLLTDNLNTRDASASKNILFFMNKNYIYFLEWINMP